MVEYTKAKAGEKKKTMGNWCLLEFMGGCTAAPKHVDKGLGYVTMQLYI